MYASSPEHLALFLSSLQFTQEPPHWIVMVVDHALLQRNDSVIRNMDILRTNLCAALGNRAETDRQFLFQQLSSRQTIKRMHLQPGDANEETRTAKLSLLVV